MKISIILGTRPEIVKFSPIIRECERLHLDYFILHTGQHYSYNLDRVFFEQLELPEAKYNLNAGSGMHGKQTGKMLVGIEKILQQESPDVILVEGDTNTVLAGAVAAAKLDIKVGHVEAGLRSYDRRMPEETNRVLADHCSDYLFAPTPKSKETLLHEGIPENQIFMVGNTIVDAVHQNLKIAKSKTQILDQLGFDEGKFMLATSHRQENVDDRNRFKGIIKGLQLVQSKFEVPLIYPIHPRAQKQLKLFGIDTSGLTMVEPLDYLTFLLLEGKAKLVLTDSGGVQEETCILGIPCITLRENTERPETIEVGANILAGTDPTKILQAAKNSIAKNKKWTNPFGDGKTGSRIINILREQLE
ncbi:MAG TPA: UDP-N-acetylglucosamine 2-epimerase (non-hydrolyzing) [Candidatus Acidoferrum sp.]|nr:UDP-N-acetylglucosamine 2-epimerase (non-hydrolyzing) [Candidatus Acidoferrum sp.]